MIPPKVNVTGGYMEDKEKMTVDERYKYLRQMQKRYKKAGRKERNRLLDDGGVLHESFGLSDGNINSFVRPSTDRSGK